MGGDLDVGSALSIGGTSHISQDSVVSHGVAIGSGDLCVCSPVNVQSSLRLKGVMEVASTVSNSSIARLGSAMPVSGDVAAGASLCSHGLLVSGD